MAQKQPRYQRRRNIGPRGPRSIIIRLQKEDLEEDDLHSCEVCGREFQRKQNLDLHLRSHNIIPQKTKARYTRDMAFTCPVTECINHRDEHALRDITAIKKHYRRKHCPKKWPCSYCGAKFAIIDDRKQHEKIHASGQRLHCVCLKAFKEKETLDSHRAFCIRAMLENNPPNVTSNDEPNVADNPQTGSLAPDYNNHPPATYAGGVNVPSSNNNIYSAAENEPRGFRPYRRESESNPASQPMSLVPVAAQNDNLNMQPALYNQMFVPGQQSGSSGPFLSRYQYDQLVNDASLTFTDLISFGTDSPMDSADIRVPIVNPLGFESYQANAALVNPRMNGLMGFNSQGRTTDHLRSDSAFNLSLRSNAQGFTSPPPVEGINPRAVAGKNNGAFPFYSFV